MDLLSITLMFALLIASWAAADGVAALVVADEAQLPFELCRQDDEE